MIEVRPAIADDADRIQPWAVDKLPEGWRDMLRDAIALGAWAVEREGELLAVAGISRLWAGRGVCWCYLARSIPKAVWPALHRAALRGIEGAGLRRIEAEVVAGWRPGERWAGLLGFYPEGVMHAYGPNGEDFTRWARVRR